MIRSRASFVVLVLLAACAGSGQAPGPVTSFAHAIATPECAPNDGPALAVYALPSAAAPVSTDEPHARAVLYRSPRDAVGRTWTWGEQSDIGSSQRCALSRVCEPAMATRLTLGQFAADSSIDVRVELSFGDGSRVISETRARWLTRQFLCG